jgi:DNA-binding NarL/FixJ family response regulator
MVAVCIWGIVARHPVVREGNNLIKVVIADDSLTIRRGVRGLLERAPGISVIGEACNGQEAIELTEKLLPHVLILDIEMPVMDGITAIINLRQKGCKVPILILSASDNLCMVMECLESGAHGYILKDEAPEFLPGAVQRAAQGKDGLNSPRITKKYKSLSGMS